MSTAWNISVARQVGTVFFPNHEGDKLIVPAKGGRHYYMSPRVEQILDVLFLELYLPVAAATGGGPGSSPATSNFHTSSLRRTCPAITP